MGLDLFFPKQMQENLKVRKPLGKGLRETPFVLASRTGANGIGLGVLGKTRVSVGIGPLKASSEPFLWLAIRKPGSISTSEAN